MCFCPETYKWNPNGMRCEKTVVVENSIKENTLSTNPSSCFVFRGTKMCRCPSDYRWDMKQQLCKLSCMFLLPYFAFVAVALVFASAFPACVIFRGCFFKCNL